MIGEIIVKRIRVKIVHRTKITREVLMENSFNSTILCNKISFLINEEQDKNRIKKLLHEFSILIKELQIL